MRYPLVPNPRLIDALPPGADPADARMLMTVSCRDADDIPKVQDAGDIHVLEGGTQPQIMFNGVRVIAGAYHGRWMSEVIRRLRGHHEPQEEKVFHELLMRLPADSSRSMIELDSFWSYYSLWFRHSFPDALTIMVEPDPANLAIGRRNFELNRQTGVFLLASAGGASRPARPFFSEETQQHYDVPEVCVDDLMERHQIATLTCCTRLSACSAS